MKRFKFLVYTSDPATGARPSLEYEAIAESQSHATKLLMDQLGNLNWCVLHAADKGGAAVNRAGADVAEPEVRDD
jgi:hypothetical protein